MSTYSITTLSGRKVDYLKPKNISLEDVALGLSRQPRFAGQLTKPYSVAQHCLLVERLCPNAGIYALLHDAQEAFLCDLPTPLKQALRKLGSTAYDELEDRMYQAICDSLGIPAEHCVSVKLADVRARKVEKQALREGKKTPYDGIFSLPDGGRKEWLQAVQDALDRMRRYARKSA